MESCANAMAEEATATKNMNPGNIPTVTNELSNNNRRKKRFLDFLKASPSKDWLLKFGFVERLSPFSFLQRSGSQRTTTYASSHRGRITGSYLFHVPFVRNVDWKAMAKYCKNWAKHPSNMALLVWLFFVVVCLVVLFLFMVGLLNGIIPKSSVRKTWTEIFNQILNALFTIMCLYQHPKIFHHLILLCRWRLSDIEELRNIYCKKGTKKPRERAHMTFVVILLHITCLSQYGLCALIWAYTDSTRPAEPQILVIVLGTVAPIIAALYTFFGPLGMKTEAENDEEAQRQLETITAKYNKRVVLTSPVWVGGLFDFCDDQAVAILSFCCTFCVFGWNMERLGFGNMYVHIITFILLCSAPVAVFSVTAWKIDNNAMGYTVGIIGIVLCLLGLLYGGFWRIQMRKKFKLPESKFCYSFSGFTDIMQWLFCWSCSLAQEVRTGNFYHVEDDGFCRKEIEERNQHVLVPVPSENEAGSVVFSGFGLAKIHSAVEMVDDFKNPERRIEGEIHGVVEDEKMRPPVQHVI